MFDTEDDKVSENKTMYVPESVAEDFANKRGYSLAIKTDVTEVTDSQHFGDSDGSMHSLYNDAVEKKIHNQSFTYVKSFDQKTTFKLVGREKRDFSGIGWDQVIYRAIKIQKIEERDFSKHKKLIHLTKGPIDSLLEKRKNK